jgi:hypothetical protein
LAQFEMRAFTTDAFAIASVDAGIQEQTQRVEEPMPAFSFERDGGQK